MLCCREISHPPSHPKPLISSIPFALNHFQLTSKSYLDKYDTFMLTFLVIVSHHSRRTPPSLLANSHSHLGSHPSFIPVKLPPFFSCTYEMQISQPFYFVIHTKCP